MKGMDETVAATRLAAEAALMNERTATATLLENQRAAFELRIRAVQDLHSAASLSVARVDGTVAALSTVVNTGLVSGMADVRFCFLLLWCFCSPFFATPASD